MILTILRSISIMVAIIIATQILHFAIKSKISVINEDDTKMKVVSTVREQDRQLQCMAQNIYFEAGKEPPEGKLAVAQVVMNRVNSGKFAADPCSVIYQKNLFYDKIVCQFSWYCENPAIRNIKHTEAFKESMEAAKMVYLEGFRLPSLTEALYYHADYVNPQWKKSKVAKIGRHIFYKDNI